MTMALFLDVFIIILIAIMIGYAVVLNNKLKIFRNAQNEMAGLVGQLNAAISQAQLSVSALKKAAIDEEGRLDGLVRKSRTLADELTILTESGENLADRIERGLIPASKRDAEIFSTESEPAENDEDASFSEEPKNEMLETLKKVR